MKRQLPQDDDPYIQRLINFKMVASQRQYAKMAELGAALGSQDYYGDLIMEWLVNHPGENVMPQADVQEMLLQLEAVAEREGVWQKGKPLRQPPATAGQLRKLHALAGRLEMPEEEYRDILMRFFCPSAKHMTRRQAGHVIEYLEALAEDAGIAWERRPAPEKPADGMATPAQLGRIKGLWASASRAEGQEAKAAALCAFLENKFHVSHLRFLSRTTASKVICALERMQPHEPERTAQAL